MDSRTIVTVNMYDLEDEKESGKCGGRLHDRKTKGNAPAAGTRASNATQPLVAVGQNDIEMMVQHYPGPWVRASQLPSLFCSWDLAHRCTKCGWLRPIVQGKRRTIYRLADVLACMQRIETGELPLPRRNKAAQ